MVDLLGLGIELGHGQGPCCWEKKKKKSQEVQLRLEPTREERCKGQAGWALREYT